MKFIKSLFLLLMSCGLYLSIQAQDVHFSQYFSSPHLVNPAFTSLFQGDMRVLANHRSQWSSILDNPYESISLAGDFKVYPTRNCDYMGLGANLLVDRAGDINFRTVQGNLSMAYFKSLDGDGSNYLSLGFSAGMAQRKIDYSPEDFLDFQEVIPNDQFSFFDLSAGLLWYYMPKPGRSSTYYYAGASIFHLNSPEQSHFADNYPFTGSDNKLARRYVIHGGLNQEVSEHVSILPSLLIQVQKPAYEVNVGSYVKYRFGHKTEMVEKLSMYLGVFYRYNDALVLAYRADIKNVYLTMSYDINISGLTASTQGAGGLELSLATVFMTGKKRNCPNPINCPKF